MLLLKEKTICKLVPVLLSEHPQQERIKTPAAVGKLRQQLVCLDISETIGKDRC